MKVTPLDHLDQIETQCLKWPYLNAIGSLLHIAQCTRPDIAYAVGALARHSSAFGREHINAVKRCAQYLYNTRHLCIQYHADDTTDLHEPTVYEATGRKLDSSTDQTLDVKAFADADYAMDPHSRRSTSGGIVFLNGGPVTWSSKLQKIVALSTAEAEIIAATDITKEIIHLRLMLAEIGVRDSRPVQIHEDNQACILMGNGMKSSRKAKHYEVRLHFLQDSIKTGVIKFVYCETDKQIADALTKPLLEDKFVYFRDLMLHAPARGTGNRIEG